MPVTTKPALQDIAKRAGVSVKTVSGALHGGNVRMAEETRARIQAIAEEMGYVTNVAARAMRQGWMPIIGLVAEGVLTTPFATDIVRALDSAARRHDLALISNNIGGKRGLREGVTEIQRFVPRAIVFAVMYHKIVSIPPELRGSIQVTINCRDPESGIPALVPAEREAGRTITTYLVEKGRRRIAFLNLPGLLAGGLRERGFRDALAEAGVECRDDWVRPATRGSRYTDLSRSLVAEHVAEMMAGFPRPDAILCGNDRVALEVYGALRRLGAAIPGDVAVASFDNQVDIAARLDPPLTTMALPHRAMGRIAVEAITGGRPFPGPQEELPFSLVERQSV
jgi:DNA-binding LacI/PurR family transcriptional regulator